MRPTARGWALVSFLGAFALVPLAAEPSSPPNPREHWVVDRIEDDLAVLVGPGGVRLVPASSLAEEAKEGDLLDEHGRPDRASTLRARAGIAARRAALTVGATW